MAFNISRLTKVANQLDDANLSEKASQIDKIANNVMQIKVAQYVGIQGYWVKNERCWSNCYRQKRATNPKMASQVVWQECQNEYVDSINNEKSDWSKYANDNSPLIKIANVSDNSIQKYIAKEKDIFNESVKNKVASGFTYPLAVFDTIEENQTKYAEQLIDQANDLLEIAKDAKDNGNDKTALILAEEANNIIKEAHSPFGGSKLNPFNWFKGTDKKLFDTLKSIHDATTKIVKETNTELESLRGIKKPSVAVEPEVLPLPEAEAVSQSTDYDYTGSLPTGNEAEASVSNKQTIKVSQNIDKATMQKKIKAKFDTFYNQLLQERGVIARMVQELQRDPKSANVVAMAQKTVQLINAFANQYTKAQGLGQMLGLINNFGTNMSSTLAGLEQSEYNMEQNAPPGVTPQQGNAQTAPAANNTSTGTPVDLNATSVKNYLGTLDEATLKNMGYARIQPPVSQGAANTPVANTESTLKNKQPKGYTNINEDQLVNNTRNKPKAKKQKKQGAAFTEYFNLLK